MNSKHASVAVEILLAGVLALGMGWNSAAGAEKEWKMHSVWNMQREEAKYFQRWTEQVNARTGNALQIKLYPGGALGIKDVDMLRILPPGNVIQVAGFYPGYASRDVGELAYLLPPGVVDSPQKIVSLLPLLEKIYQGAYTKWGVKLIDLTVPLHSAIDIMCREPVNTLDALRSKKVRVWERHTVETFAKLGVAAQIISQGDLYVAMKTGVVDCAFYVAALAKSISLQEVAPYASYLTPHAIHPHNIIVSQKAWDSLTPKLQQILLEEVAKVHKAQTEAFLAGTWQQEAMKEFVASGGHVIAPFSKADQETFTKAATEVWKKLSEEAGPKATENYELITEALQR
jgi:TRAP-type transport system periplasmic protein